MAVSLTCQNIRRINGTSYVRWSDKTEQEFQDVAHVRDHIRALVRSGEVQDFLRTLALAKWLAVNPTGNNPDLLVGRTITIDLDAAANLVRIA